MQSQGGVLELRMRCSDLSYLGRAQLSSLTPVVLNDLFTGDQTPAASPGATYLFTPTTHFEHIEAHSQKPSKISGFSQISHALPLAWKPISFFAFTVKIKYLLYQLCRQK